MLSDPNMDPYYLGMLVMVGTNKSKFKPPQQSRSATTPSFAAKVELTSRSRWAEWLYS